MLKPDQVARERVTGDIYECAWKPTNFFGGITSRISLNVLEGMDTI